MTYRVDKHGSVEVPTTTVVATGGSLEPVFDPSIIYLLGVFRAVLRATLDTPWAAAANNISTHVVEDIYPYEPIAPVATVTWTWPALFMWRVSERCFKRTQVWNDVEVTGKLTYVMPPMPYDLIQKLGPIRTAIRVKLHQFIEQFGDPGYSSGVNPIAAQLLESFTLTQAQYGYLPSAAGMELLHPVIDFTWEMRERQEYVASNYGDLSDIETILEVKPETGTGSGLDLVETTFDATP